MEIFTKSEGLILLILLIAHLLADFIFQSKSILEGKDNLKISSYLFHGLIVLLFSCLILIFCPLNSEFTIFSFIIAILIVTVSHIIIGFCKLKLAPKIEAKKLLFFLDQISHIIFIFLAWSLAINKFPLLFTFIYGFISNFNYLLIILVYLFCTKPASIIITKILENLFIDSEKKTDGLISVNSIKGTGSLIGISERLIIITLVLLNQYTAIAFLATAKSILRVDNKGSNHDNFSNNTYVLLGTLLSFAIAILVGLLCNFVLIKSFSSTLPELFRITK